MESCMRNQILQIFWHMLNSTAAIPTPSRGAQCLLQTAAVSAYDKSLRTGQVKWSFSYVPSHPQAVVFRDLLILLPL